MTGTVARLYIGGRKEIAYQIGDMLIVASAPIPELEEKLGREIVLRVEEGFPLRRTMRPAVESG